MDKNLDDYVDGKLTVSDGRVLTTKWVGNACERICQSRDMIIRSFKKCGITMTVDHSKNSQVNVQGLKDYVILAPEEEFQLETSLSEKSEDQDWVTDIDDNVNNNCATDFEESSTSHDENKN